jgi:ABC-type glutathione transport system ATPase component
MQQFRQRGTTMVFISHELDSVARISDRVALMISGQLADVGEPARVIDGYRSKVLAA